MRSERHPRAGAIGCRAARRAGCGKAKGLELSFFLCMWDSRHTYMCMARSLCARMCVCCVRITLCLVYCHRVASASIGCGRSRESTHVRCGSDARITDVCVACE
jgi:hypothetical protein